MRVVLWELSTDTETIFVCEQKPSAQPRFPVLFAFPFLPPGWRKDWWSLPWRGWSSTASLHPAPLPPPAVDEQGQALPQICLFGSLCVALVLVHRRSTQIYLYL